MTATMFVPQPVAMPTFALPAFLRGDHPLAQLLRFAAVGGTSNVAYLLAFVACDALGPLWANVIGSVVSTVVANELHRHLTFRARESVTWLRAQLQGGATALIGLLISTAGLTLLSTAAPALPALAQATAVLALSAAVGLLRFAALRTLVF
ncbi:GtrA family protein [Nocardia camponoti]|uniref:GtrA/DPMS transmembrane domain-containing protein n=1 Tax=Nocardia camponoti TaxID=1616106 RepID=A0A917QFR3_9NOCA|nr:GtrA family protein [Nocardia camponoti]GGK49232.1 hypothetical protein GCM10011591_20790 [Nocardia camponoti]